MPAPALALESVTVRYGARLALDDVTLDVDEGDFVGVVGPNGSGKTTLLRASLGLVEPDAGSVRVLGQAPGELDEPHRVGYVRQRAADIRGAFPASVLEVALLGRVGPRGVGRRYRAADREAALEALERVGVADLAGRGVSKLSAGEVQRVLLARALAGDPDLLLLDEPAAGVDPSAREGFYNLVDGLNHDEGVTIVLVSHDVQAVEAVCHRLVALNREVVYDGSPAGFEEEGGFSEVHEMDVVRHRGGLPGEGSP